MSSAFAFNTQKPYKIYYKPGDGIQCVFLAGPGEMKIFLNTNPKITTTGHRIDNYQSLFNYVCVMSKNIPKF